MITKKSAERGRADETAPKEAVFAEGTDRKRKAEREDMRAILALPEGRRVVRRLLQRADPFASTFNTDASTMAFAEGHRNMGLMLLAMIADAAPDALADIMVAMGRGGKNR